MLPGEEAGPSSGLPETCKGREGAVISSLGLDQAYPGHRASVTRGDCALAMVSCLESTV